MFWQIATGVAAALALLGGFWVAHLAQQIRQLGRQVRDIRTGKSSDAISVTLLDPALHELATEVEELRLAIREDRARATRARAATKEQLISTTHDLRTPLVSMRGFLQLARRTPQERVDERDSYLAVAEEKVGLMSRYISDYFDISMIDAGDVPITLETVDATALIGEVIVDCLNAGRDDIDVDVRVPDEAVRVLADATALRRIAQNLVLNALEYATGPVVITLDRSGPAFEVRNAAADLAPGDVSRLFQRGYRVDRARSGGHAGVGLAIVAGLAERMPMSITSELLDGDFRMRVALTPSTTAGGHADQATRKR